MSSAVSSTALRRRSVRVLAASAFAVLPVFAFASPAAAASFDITFDCQGDSPLGAQQFNLNQATDVVAPEQVAPGGALDIVVDPAPNTIPPEVNGYEVKQVEGVNLVIPIPANSTYVDAQLSGGTNVGTPTITVDGGLATIHIEQPLAGGQEFEFPTVTVQLTAGDAGPIDTRLHGSSYEDPGLTFNAVVGTPIGDQDVPTGCFPNPNPVLTTTTVG